MRHQNTSDPAKGGTGKENVSEYIGAILLQTLVMLLIVLNAIL